MEIRQVLKSSASMIPVLFYKVSDGQTKPGGAKRYRKGVAAIAEEVIGGIKGLTVDFRWEHAAIHEVDVARCEKSHQM